MSDERKYFGIDTDNSFSLKRRMWAKLVERLAVREIEQDDTEPTLFRFYEDAERVVILRIQTKPWEEGTLRSVELLSLNGEVLASEEFHPNGIDDSYNYHPLTELFELVSNSQTGKAKQNLEQARNIASFLEGAEKS